jgi:hypothetical protein
MTTSKRTTAAACVGLAALLTYAGASQPLKVDFSDETVGAEPKSFVSVVETVCESISASSSHATIFNSICCSRTNSSRISPT